MCIFSIENSGFYNLYIRFSPGLLLFLLYTHFYELNCSISYSYNNGAGQGVLENWNFRKVGQIAKVEKILEFIDNGNSNYLYQIVVDVSANLRKNEEKKLQVWNATPQGVLVYNSLPHEPPLYHHLIWLRILHLKNVQIQSKIIIRYYLIISILGRC